MDTTARRGLLSTGPNPGARLDYVVSLEGALDAQLSVVLRYVPDKAVLEDGAFAAYLRQFENTAGERMEALGVTILEDVNNEVVPRWVQVSVAKREETGPASEHHGVLLEDRQPRWDNRSLLSQLRRY
ncbi:MAG: hypothetical protein ISR47_01730 [Rhodospirillales bacterium]|nr:hypothetical protein [Rhodospirillales bacterium]